jgi:hypothetical protein
MHDELVSIAVLLVQSEASTAASSSAVILRDEGLGILAGSSDI